MAIEKRVEVSKLRHNYERDMSLADQAIQRFKDEPTRENFELALFYMMAAIEVIGKRIERITPKPTDPHDPERAIYGA